MRHSLVVLLAAMALPAAGLEANREYDSYAIGEVPDGARVTLEFDKPEYLLGENILVHYVLENTGKFGFRISMGSDYRGASRALRYKVTATDEEGKPVEDPDPSGFFMGGQGWTPTVNPKERYVTSLPLIRYCRFEKPGVYTLRVRHDLGWKETAERKVPVGETTIRLLMPTPDQARQVVEETYSLPKDPNRTSGEKCRPYADFTTLYLPVYLPILLERARAADEKALEAIGTMDTPEATEALIGLLGQENRAFVLKAAGTVNCRLPDPEFEGKLGPRSPFRSGLYDRRRELAKKAWRPDFAPTVLARARELLAWREGDSMSYGAFMIQCLGGKEDLAPVMAALDYALDQTKSSFRAELGYPAPSGPCGELLRAAQALLQKGAEAPADPQSLGQAVVFLSALGLSGDFRPEGWEARCLQLLQHENPYIRQVALRNAPKPLTKPLIEALPRLLADPDTGVKVYACQAAGESKAPELKEPVLKVLASAKDRWLLNAANNAASQLGVRYDALETWVARLEEAEMGHECIMALTSSVITSHGSGWDGTLAADVARLLKLRWTNFLRDHRAALEAGTRFEIGSPEITPDLVPPNLRLYGKDMKPWP